MSRELVVDAEGLDLGENGCPSVCLGRRYRPILMRKTRFEGGVNRYVVDSGFCEDEDIWVLSLEICVESLCACQCALLIRASDSTRLLLTRRQPADVPGYNPESALLFLLKLHLLW